MRDERRPGTIRYRRSDYGCGAFGHGQELQAFLAEVAAQAACLYRLAVSRVER
jgi:hypothetical protein